MSLFDDLPPPKSSSVPTATSTAVLEKPCSLKRDAGKATLLESTQQPKKAKSNVALPLPPPPPHLPASQQQRVTCVAASAHGKGRRCEMEDAVVMLEDLHQAITETVVVQELGADAQGGVLTPSKLASSAGADVEQVIDARELSGNCRKVAAQFAKSLQAIRGRFFASEKPQGQAATVPRMAFYGVYDGHGGRRAADFCRKWLHVFVYFELFQLVMEAPPDMPSTRGSSCTSGGGGGEDEKSAQHHCFQHLPQSSVERGLTEACHKCDDLFLKDYAIPNQWSDGCTAVGVIIIANDVYCLSIGDSRACMAWFKESPTAELGPVSVISGKEHKASLKSEALRVAEGNGFVKDGRVLGALAVSRSIGDFYFKRHGVTSTPNISRNSAARASLIVLACDGLWDVYPTTSVMELVFKRLYSSSNSNADSSKSSSTLEARQAELKEICSQLIKDAITVRKSKDNVSLVVVQFVQQQQQGSEE